MKFGTGDVLLERRDHVFPREFAVKVGNMLFLIAQRAENSCVPTQIKANDTNIITSIVCGVQVRILTVTIKTPATK